MIGDNSGSTKQNIYLPDPKDFSQLGTDIGSITTTTFKQTFRGTCLAARNGNFTGDRQFRRDDTRFKLTDVCVLGQGVGLDGTAARPIASTISTRLNYAMSLNDTGLTFVQTGGLSYTPTSVSAIRFANGESQATDSFDKIVGFIGATLANTKVANSGVAGTTTFAPGTYFNDIAVDHTPTFTNAFGGTNTITTFNLSGFAESGVGASQAPILDEGTFGGTKQVNASIRADAHIGPNVSNSYGVTAPVRFLF